MEVTRTRRTVAITEDELAAGRRARDEFRELLAGAEAVYSPSPKEFADYNRLGVKLFVKLRGEVGLVDAGVIAAERGWLRGDDGGGGQGREKE